MRRVVQLCCHCEVCPSCAATLGSRFSLPLWSGALNALCSSGQRQRIKEQEERKRGGEGRSGVAVSDTHFCPVVECEPGLPLHTEGTI